MTGVFVPCSAHSLSKQQMKGAKTKYRFPVNYELKFVLFSFSLYLWKITSMVISPILGEGWGMNPNHVSNITSMYCDDI